MQQGLMRVTSNSSAAHNKNMIAAEEDEADAERAFYN